MLSENILEGALKLLYTSKKKVLAFLTYELFFSKLKNTEKQVIQFSQEDVA